MKTNINTIINANIKTRNVADPFKKTFPNNFIYFHIKAKQQDNIIIDNQRIIELTWGYNESSRGNDEFLYCITSTGKTLVKSIINSESSYHLYQLFKQLTHEGRAQKCLAFNNRTIAPLNWQDYSIETIYKQEIKESYGNIHDNLIINLELLLKNSSAKNITVIDLGCGSGDFFTKFAKHQNHYQAEWNYLGIDLNSENIAKCKELKSPKEENLFKSSTFYQGNILELEKILDAKQLAVDVKNNKILVISSGSLTRGVLRNGFEILTVLQKVAALKVHYIVGDGYDIPVINDYMANQLGYEQNTGKIGQSKHFYSYRKLSESDLFLNKYSQLAKDNTLDLSLTHNPVFYLLNLKKEIVLKKDLTIDLSFCHMTEKLMTILESILQKNPGIKLIFWHFEQEMVDTFEERFSIQNAYSVMAASVDDDIYLLGPRKFFTAVLTEHPLIIDLQTIEKKKFTSKLAKYEAFIQVRIENKQELQSKQIKSYLSELKYPAQSVQFIAVKNMMADKKLTLKQLNDFVKFKFLNLKLVKLLLSKKVGPKMIQLITKKAYNQLISSRNPSIVLEELQILFNTEQWQDLGSNGLAIQKFQKLIHELYLQDHPSNSLTLKQYYNDFLVLIDLSAKIDEIKNSNPLKLINKQILIDFLKKEVTHIYQDIGNSDFFRLKTLGNDCQNLFLIFYNFLKCTQLEESLIDLENASLTKEMDDIYGLILSSSNNKIDDITQAISALQKKQKQLELSKQAQAKENLNIFSLNIDDLDSSIDIGIVIMEDSVELKAKSLEPNKEKQQSPASPLSLFSLDDKEKKSDSVIKTPEKIESESESEYHIEPKNNLEYKMNLHSKSTSEIKLREMITLGEKGKGLFLERMGVTLFSASSIPSSDYFDQDHAESSESNLEIAP